MNYFKVPNNIFELGLKSNEVTALCYLLSIPKNKRKYIPVKYECIAKNIGYKSVSSAVSVIKSLELKGFISVTKRYNYEGNNIANGYVVNVPVYDNCFFMVSRKDFKKATKFLGVNGASVYLYVCKCMNKGGSAFPSLNNVKNALAIAKTTVIKKLYQLRAMTFIKIINRLKKNGSYTNNLYIKKDGATRPTKASKPQNISVRTFKIPKSFIVVKDLGFKVKICTKKFYTLNNLRTIRLMF
ncbi:MAG: hypothetical protein RR048_00240 [Oscillospiraceae bacterium]